DAAAVVAAIVDAALRARLFSLTRLRLLLLLRLLTRLRLLLLWPRLLLRLLSARFGARRGAAVGSTRFAPRLCLFPRLAWLLLLTRRAFPTVIFLLGERRCRRQRKSRQQGRRREE